MPTLACPSRSLATFGGTPARKQVRGVGGSQIMETNARQRTLRAEKADPLLPDAMRA